MLALLTYFTGGLIFLWMLTDGLAAWWTDRDDAALWRVGGLLVGGALAVVLRL